MSETDGIPKEDLMGWH